LEDCCKGIFGAMASYVLNPLIEIVEKLWITCAKPCGKLVENLGKILHVVFHRVFHSFSTDFSTGFPQAKCPKILGLRDFSTDFGRLYYYD